MIVSYRNQCRGYVQTVVAGVFCAALLTGVSAAENLPYAIVDTAQVRAYDNSKEVEYPKPGAAFFGQDAFYKGNQPAYKDNGDGTITDLVTGLMWQSDPGEKMTHTQALAGASKFKLGGYSDWRLPTIKELYSLILFSGTDPDPMAGDASNQKPFIDQKYFQFEYGDQAKGERIIDSQFATSTKYVSKTMRGDETMFGVNFADGRIKGYGMKSPRTNGEKTFFVLYVRGNKEYGKNDFKDNGDGTVTDAATGLTWMQVDSGKFKVGKDKDGKLNWQEALAWAEGLEYAGHSDWRLPNVKELQSIVDYTRSPDTSGSAAIDPVFQVTSFASNESKKDFPFYWSGTTHASVSRASTASYVAFGKSNGWMQNRRTGEYTLMDVHGAGSQRSDPKSGDPSLFPRGRGPQGDVIRIYNFVRCVRGGVAEMATIGPKVQAMQVQSRRQQMGGEGMSPGGRRGMGMERSGMAGGPPQGGMRIGFVKRLDQDGDGKVSKTEFDGPANVFSTLDKNKDGYLSEDEAPQGPPAAGMGGPGLSGQR